MAIGDVPVETTKKFDIALISREIGVGASVIAVLIHQVLVDKVHVRGLGTRDAQVAIALAIFGGSPFHYLLWALFVLSIDEEEELILYNRTTEGHTVDILFLLRAYAKVYITDAIASHILIVEIGVGRSAERCV